MSYPVEVQKGYQYNLQHKDGVPDTYENIRPKAEDLRQVHEDLQGIYKALGATIKKHEQIAEKDKQETQIQMRCMLDWKCNKNKDA